MHQGPNYNDELLELSVPIKPSSIQEESLREDLASDLTTEGLDDDENQYFFDAQLEDK